MPLPSGNTRRPSLAVTGSLPPTATTDRVVVRLTRTSNFFYKFHPSRWMFVDLGKCGECAGCKANSKNSAAGKPCVNDGRGEFLPQLGKLKLDGGVGGCDYDPSTGFKIKDALENARQNGWTVIMPAAVGYEYVRVYDGLGGKVHLPMWASVIPQPGRRPAHVETDHDAYHAFLRDLVERGIVPPIDEITAAALVKQQADRLSRNATLRASSPGLDHRMTREENTLRGMHWAIDQMGADNASK